MIKRRLKAGPRRFKQLIKNLKMKPLSQPSILYLNLHASLIQNVGLQLERRMSTSELCWNKKCVFTLGFKQQPLDQRPYALQTELFRLI